MKSATPEGQQCQSTEYADDRGGIRASHDLCGNWPSPDPAPTRPTPMVWIARGLSLLGRGNDEEMSSTRRLVQTTRCRLVQSTSHFLKRQGQRR